MMLKKNAALQQSEVNQSRRFTLGQYIAAVSVLLLSATAISYAAGLINLVNFGSGSTISAKDVNDNFTAINTALNDLNNKIAAAESASANLYQPKFGTAGWIDVTAIRSVNQTYHNAGNTPRFVMIYHGSSYVNFISSSAADLSNAILIGPDASANNATQTASGSYVVPPNYYYRIDGVANNWYEYTM